MYRSEAPTSKHWNVLKKILDDGFSPTVKIGKDASTSQVLDIIYYSLDKFLQEVEKVYIADLNAGDFDLPGRTLSDCLPFDSSDYPNVDRIMFSTSTYTIYIESWKYYYDDDEVGKSEMIIHAVREGSPRNLLLMSKNASVGLKAV